MASDWIEIRGAREHNLKNVDVDIPREQLVVITGLSGSGKSSLAFDTIYAEGQRRYVESLSAYARQFLGQMDKPDVDSIEGLSPAISIDQKTTSRNPRSTVGTVTEIYDYLRLLFARVGHPHCPNCGRPIARPVGRADRRPACWRCPTGTRLHGLRAGRARPQGRVRRTCSRACAARASRACKVDGEMRELLEEASSSTRSSSTTSTSSSTGWCMKDDLRKRLADSVETALALADGHRRDRASSTARRTHVLRDVRVPRARRLAAPSWRRACFSFNSPHGACPACDGLGTTPELDPDLIVPDADALDLPRARSLPWTGRPRATTTQRDPAPSPTHFGVSTRHAWGELPDEQRKTVPLRHGRRARPRHATRTATGRSASTWSPSKASSPTSSAATARPSRDCMREQLEEYMTRRPCPTCNGARLQARVAGGHGRRAVNIDTVDRAVGRDGRATFFDGTRA